MKLEKPLEEEMDLLLNEIPIATSSPLTHHHHPYSYPPVYHQPIHAHAHAHAHVHAHPSPYPSSSTSTSTSTSPSSSLSSINDEVNALELLAQLRNLNLNYCPNPNPNPNPNPYPNPLNAHPYIYHAYLRRAQPGQPPARARPTLYSPDDSTFILDGSRAHEGVGIKKRLEGSGPGSIKFENLVEVPGYIYHCAKDQSGCRLLQRKFDEGRRQDVDRIFNGIVGHVADLMMNPFGNYLVQKLLDVCTEEQRMMIVLKLTRDPSEIIRVSLNTHG